MKRPLKILFAIVGALAVVFVLAAILLPFAVNVDRLRPLAEARLQSTLGRRASLGAVRLSLWTGLALRAESLRIGEPLAGPASGAIVAEAGPTTVRVALLPLLRRDVQVRSIAIENLRLTQDGRPLVSELDVSSRVRISPDGAVEAAGSADGTLSAMTAAPRVRATFAATLVRGTLEIAALEAAIGPVRLSASGHVADVLSAAPHLVLNGSASLKRSKLAGRVELVLAAAQPKASFTVAAPLLDTDEVLAAVASLTRGPSASRASFSVVPQARADESVTVASGPSLARRLEIDGTMRADRCVSRRLELTDLSLRLSLARGLVELQDVVFALYGGTARGHLTVRPFDRLWPFSLEQTAAGVAMGPLIAALAPAQSGTLEGTASIDVGLSGSASGPSILPSLNGAGHVAIVDGRIASFGVVKQVMKTLEIAGARGIARDETPFDHLSAHFDLAQGTAGTKDLEFRSRDLDGDGTGTVGLGGALKFDVLASFSKAVSDDLVATTRALSIRQDADGRLSVPLQIRGTIRDPRIQLDLDRILHEGVLNELKKEGAKSILKQLLGR